MIMQSRTRIKSAFIALCLLTITNVSHTQSVDVNGDFFHDYILYNNYPYYVSMTSDGEILEFLRFAPELLKGKLDPNTPPPMPLGPYTKPIAQALPVYISPLNTTDIEQIEVTEKAVAEKMISKPTIQMNKNVSPSKVREKSKETTAMNTTIIRKEQSPPKDAVITRGENVKEDFLADLEFQGFSARLTPELILQIEDVHKAYEESENKLIQIRSFVTAGDDTNKKLAKNRMDACKDLLITYGVPAEDIDTGIRPYNSAYKGNVSIELVDQLDNG